MAHAEQIEGRLAATGEHPIIVNYQTPEAQRIISNFKASSDRWIISVGMISEGTDIPRLQVCCHLSRIRTELHFRQVLGRILRRQPEDPADTSAWLYVLAEPNLAEFARRIGEDLPGEKVVSFVPNSETLGTQKSKAMKFYQDNNFAFTLNLEDQSSVDDSGQAGKIADEEEVDLCISNQYWNEVLALFATSN